MDRSRSPRRRLDDSAIEEFVAENEIDESAANILREQSKDVQRAVIEEGQVTGRNKSAILVGRIKRVAAATKPVGQPGRPPIRVAAASKPVGQPGRQPIRPLQPVVQQDDSPISRFVAENGLDAMAEQKLRQQTPVVQDLVLAEGPLTGRNPSAVFSGRLRRILDSGAPQQLELDFALDAFCMDNGLDQHARDNLWQQMPEVTQAVIEEGPLTGRNPSAILKSRIRRILDGTSPAQLQWSQGAANHMQWQPQPQLQQWHQPMAPQWDWPAAPARPVGVAARPVSAPVRQSRPAGRSASPISIFVKENGLDAKAEQQLREQTPAVQEAAIEEGPVTGRNVSAVFGGRLRRILANPPPEAPLWDWPAALARPVGASARPVSAPVPQSRPAGRSASPISIFVKENGLDAKVEQQLREQSPAVQKAAIEEGPVTGRNVSAVFGGRLRRILANPPPEEQEDFPQQEEQEDIVAQFAAENGLDEVALQALREAPEHVQQSVVEEGPVTGRNVNAVFLGRLRRALRSA